MAKKFDYIIVVDLEGTCWESIEEQGDQHSEIIQIGACAFYPKTGDIKDQTSIYIRPTRSRISKYCTDLTGLTWDFLRVHGLSADGAINTFRKKFGPKHRVWASWGNWDHWKLADDCSLAEIPYPCGASHLNIKELHAIKRKLPRALGLQSALKHEGMVFEGRHHDGEWDAWNAARILRRVLE